MCVIRVQENFDSCSIFYLYGQAVAGSFRENYRVFTGGIIPRNSPTTISRLVSKNLGVFLERERVHVCVRNGGKIVRALEQQRKSRTRTHPQLV